MCNNLSDPSGSITETLIAFAGPSWEGYVEHPFITQLEAGTLPIASFLYFIRQGYRFLLHYARAHAIAGYKSNDLQSLAASNAVMQSCVKEVEKNAVVSIFCMFTRICTKLNISIHYRPVLRKAWHFEVRTRDDARRKRYCSLQPMASGSSFH